MESSNMLILLVDILRIPQQGNWNPSSPWWISPAGIHRSPEACNIEVTPRDIDIVATEKSLLNFRSNPMPISKWACLKIG